MSILSSLFMDFIYFDFPQGIRDQSEDSLQCLQESDIPYLVTTGPEQFPERPGVGFAALPVGEKEVAQKGDGGRAPRTFRMPHRFTREPM